jgi:predicted phage terminase large subunit-like protein
MGFDFGIIDDPVKSKKEAESPTFRDAVWEWYTSDFYTRQEGNAGILITTTRWHDDDLAGRLLKQAANDPSADQWEVINFPALFESDTATPTDPRKEGEALWPEKFSETRLAKTKLLLGRAFSALYQQRPQPREGGLFKLAHLQLVNAVPALMRRVRYWDKAATKGGGDYTVGVLMGEYNGRYYVENVVRGQWETDERNAIIRNTAQQDRLKYGDVINVTEEEPGSSGKDASRAFITMLAGFSVAVERVTGSKEIRAVPFSDQWAADNVFVLSAPWTNEYVDELTAFPTGAHDDQVDPSAGAFSRLAGSATQWGGIEELGKEEFKSKWR